jgi:hypothetical protein
VSLTLKVIMAVLATLNVDSHELRRKLEYFCAGAKERCSKATMEEIV